MPDKSATTQPRYDATTSIAKFYGLAAFGLLIAFTLFSIVLDESLELFAVLIVPMLAATALAFITENSFCRVAEFDYLRSKALRYLGWPVLAAMCGFLLALPLSFLLTSRSINFDPQHWFGWRTTPLAIFIFGAGVVDMLATWYRGKRSERYCRLRLRGWLALVVAQQMALTLVEIIRVLGDGYPWVFWGYVGIVASVTTLVLVARLIVLFWPMRREQSA